MTLPDDTVVLPGPRAPDHDRPGARGQRLPGMTAPAARTIPLRSRPNSILPRRRARPGRQHPARPTPATWASSSPSGDGPRPSGTGPARPTSSGSSTPRAGPGFRRGRWPGSSRPSRPSIAGRVLEGRIEKSPALNLTSPKAWLSLPKFLTRQGGRRPCSTSPTSPRPRACATRPCSRSCTPRACASPSSSACGSRTSGCGTGFSSAAARAARSGSCRWGGRRSRPSVRERLISEDVVSRAPAAKGASETLFLTRRGTAFTRQGFWKMLKGYAAGGRAGGQGPSPCPAPFLRHPPAREGRGPALGPADARATARSRRPRSTPTSAGSGCARSTTSSIPGLKIKFPRSREDLSDSEYRPTARLRGRRLFP